MQLVEIIDKWMTTFHYDITNQIKLIKQDSRWQFRRIDINMSAMWIDFIMCIGALSSGDISIMVRDKWQTNTCLCFRDDFLTHSNTVIPCYCTIYNFVHESAGPVISQMLYVKQSAVFCSPGYVLYRMPLLWQVVFADLFWVHSHKDR